MGLLRFDERPAPGWFLALRTFRSDGTGVVTPVWSVELDGRRYVLTPARSGKARRVKGSPPVRRTRLTPQPAKAVASSTTSSSESTSRLGESGTPRSGMQ